MKTSHKPRRTQIPKVSEFHKGPYWAWIRFPMPVPLTNPERGALAAVMLAAVNRALYDFNRGAGK